jgi:hypothetical protein
VSAVADLFDRARELRVGAVVGLALLAAFLVWLLIVRDDETLRSSGANDPVAVGEADLAALAQSVGHPVYWAGERENTTLELTETNSGNVFIRYLPSGTEVGAEQPAFLTVGTYPYKDAILALEEVGQREGAVVREIEGGGLAVTSGKSPTSVYIAYPDDDLQIEVYDPDAEAALDLATSGEVRPVE